MARGKRHVNSEHLSMVAAFLWPHMTAGSNQERATRAVKEAYDLIIASQEKIFQEEDQDDS